MKNRILAAWLCAAMGVMPLCAQTGPVANGRLAQIPPICTVGQLYFATDATAGQNLYLCTGVNVWTQISGGSGGGGGVSEYRVTFGFNAGGPVLSGTYTSCNNLGIAGTIQQVTIYGAAAAAGGATVTFQTGTAATYISSGQSGITTTIGSETLASTYGVLDTTLSGWTKAVSANTALCVTVSGVTNYTQITGEVLINP
jgi:hypothetical protein